MGRLLALLLALVAGSWIAFLDEQLPESQPVSSPATEFGAAWSPRGGWIAFTGGGSDRV